MRKIFKCIPMIIVIFVIWQLTTQDTAANVEMSEKLRLFLQPYIEDGWWNTPEHFRKIAHIVEYLILGIAVKWCIKRIFNALLLCVGISFLDQIVKSQLPQRHFDLTDLPFDMYGYIIGILIAIIIFAFKKKKS